MTRLSGPVPLSDDHPDELLNRSITPQPLHTDAESLEGVYEIERTRRLLREGKFESVALQFPDDMLHHAASVSQALQKDAAYETYILADTSYGSCCVDEVAAEHVAAEVVVHYGRACLSPTTRLPVIYVFGRRSVDIDSIASQFVEAVPDKDTNILLIYTNVTKHPIPDTSQIILPQSTDDDTDRLLPSTPSLAPETTLLLIAEQKDSTTTLLSYSFTTTQTYLYSPTTKTLLPSSPSTNTALRRRYVAVQKARDAGTIGILIGTLGKGGYLTLISTLRRMCLERGKKPYLLALGKVNEAKVANFAECDVFVMVACPESTVVDSRNYFKPIVTPFELWLALTAPADGAPAWGTQWITDFSRILTLEDPSPSSDSEDIPHFSLITGKLVYPEQSRPMRHITPKTEIEYEDGALVPRETGAVAVRKDGTVAIAGVRSLAGEKLVGRSWRGLDNVGGEDDGAEVEMGRMGVARRYRAADEMNTR